jgi:carbon-monoxide dehydrogenase catalytic subunit
MNERLVFADSASQEMAQRAERENVATVWTRYESMQPQCAFGLDGICCRICAMGPCRISKKNPVGICGAGRDAIAARNLARMIAGGAAAHSDHGRGTAYTLFAAAQGAGCAYRVADEPKLRAVAERYSVAVKDRDVHAVAADVAAAALAEFGRPNGHLATASIAPQKRQSLWHSLGIYPRAIDREIVETMHRTTMGVDSDFRNIIRHGMRTALADGWGGSMIATDISDVLFGRPDPLRSTANLGVLKAGWVNVLVHGHEPSLSDIIAIMSQDKELVAAAKAGGAAGINVAGICCTANEILMRHGIPVAGTFLQQELALMTGAVDLMMVDVQCVMPALDSVAKCFHTRLVTTSPKARMPGVEHIEFHEERAIDTAKTILRAAIANFANRNPGRVAIPGHTEKLVAGFTAESVFRFLGGTYRATYRPLNDAIIAGRLRGAAGVVGCSNPNVPFEENHIKLVKELIKNDTLVVTTGCNAISCAKHGLLRPEAAFEHAGKGLQEICGAVGIPPVLHLGSCVDNSRILQVLTAMLAEGGLGGDLADLPVAGAAPEWMSEKAVAIGFYFVASGVFTVIGKPLPVMGSENLVNYLTQEIAQEVGGKWAFEPDPIEAARAMLSHIDRKRAALKLRPMRYEQAFPPQ